MREAVIISTARANIATELVEDVVMGCAVQQGSSGGNTARRPADHGPGHDDGPPVLVRPDGDRDRALF